MLIHSAEKLLTLLRDPRSTREQILPLAQTFLDDARLLPPAQQEGSLALLAQAITLENPARAQFAANLCGAMVENGASATPMREPLLHRLTLAAAGAVAFFEALTSVLPKEPDEEQFQKAFTELSHEMPAGANDWHLIDGLFAPAVLLLSLIPAARYEAADIGKSLLPLADFNNGARWISMLARVLHQEPYVAIEPATGVGIRGHMSGIVDNFQLNVLLMDAFPLPKGARRRVLAQAAQVARGVGHQTSEEILHGAWNLYTWKALQPDATLPDPKSQKHDHWIWNEGHPGDIPIFEGVRLILLGPPSYDRTWKSQRMFARLPAELTCDATLTPADVRDTLARVAAAPR